MSICYIFAAGDAPESLPFRPGEGDFVIAADAGYRVCRKEGIQPDLLLGDFDSMERPADCAVLCGLPVEKDDTDTLAALNESKAELDEAQQDWLWRYEVLNYCGMVDLFDEARPMFCMD